MRETNTYMPGINAPLPAQCNCYVAKLPEEVRFTLHRGAHSLTCPQWRKSRDPVDHAHDVDFRHRMKHTFRFD